MKYLTIFLISLKSWCSFAQGDIEFPIDVQFDPASYQLKQFHFKAIEQSSRHPNSPYSEFWPEYVFTYDSLQQLVSMKYDFHLEHKLEHNYGGQVSVIVSNGPKMLYHFFNGTDTITYNSSLWEYVYEGWSLKTINIQHPVATGIIDGVYLSERVPPNSVTEVNTLENKVLVKKETCVDGKDTWTYYYYYKSFARESYEDLKLLERVVEEHNGKVEKETRIKYFQ